MMTKNEWVCTSPSVRDVCDAPLGRHGLSVATNLRLPRMAGPRCMTLLTAWKLNGVRPAWHCEVGGVFRRVARDGYPSPAL